jgi:outer membrane protein assembly factor BamB
VTKKYYDSFGPIVSEMLVFEDNLYFGARNPQMTVLNAETGETVWIKNENDSTGGWIVGTPVISNNTLFIGGSDSFELYALNPEDGSEKWKYHCGLNIYTKPLITEDEVIFTAGYGYWYWENYHPKSGMLGGLFILDRNSGELITKQDFKQPIFSSPVRKDNTIYFGSYDGNVYSVKYN